MAHDGRGDVKERAPSQDLQGVKSGRGQGAGRDVDIGAGRVEKPCLNVGVRHDEGMSVIRWEKLKNKKKAEG